MNIRSLKITAKLELRRHPRIPQGRKSSNSVKRSRGQSLLSKWEAIARLLQWYIRDQFCSTHQNHQHRFFQMHRNRRLSEHIKTSKHGDRKWVSSLTNEGNVRQTQNRRQNAMRRTSESRTGSPTPGRRPVSHLYSSGKQTYDSGAEAGPRPAGKQTKIRAGSSNQKS